MKNYSRFVAYCGQEIPLLEAVKLAGCVVHPETAWKRICKLGWDAERAVTTPRLKTAPPRKTALTDAQRDRIVKAWLAGKYIQAHRIAEEYGVDKKYIANLRFRLNLPPRPKKIVTVPKYEDPRWQWAKERGAISL